jgi:hypothetical protein
LSISGGDGVIVCAVKAIEKVGDEFTLIKGFAEGDQLGCIALHLGEELRHSYGGLLGVVEGST